MSGLRFALFSLTAALAAHAADVKTSVAGGNIKTYKLMSESLGQERHINVLLPLDYEASTIRYPVLYLLHGLGDDHTAWSYMTNLSGYAAKHNLIVVMPDAARSFYVNSAADPKAKYEDFIVKDLVPYIDSRFRTIPLRRSRAVAGLSMGGYGAALIGLKHHARFAAIGAFSGALSIARPAAATAGGRGAELQALFGAADSPERKEMDPFSLLEKVPAESVPMLYIACGGQDFLIASNREFVAALASRKIPYEYREISPRGHTWDFWDDHIRVFLDKLAGLPGFHSRP
ncbi:MAG: esterase family protein [Acidimicrobiia bacterium]|nr:esterase family protein [Acidimicrobiia bacterium]